MSLDKLKSTNNLDKLLSAVKEDNKDPSEKKSYVDERLWKPELDTSGNGYAVIRFLPAIEGEDLPWVKLFSHAFQGPTGQWYIENSRTTLGRGDVGKDPVSEYNTSLWNSGVETDKEIARKQKRKLSYYSNIYVVSDSKNPQNEGKVFLFRYGKKIFDKLMAAMQPEFEDESPINPFDFWKGANFKLKIRKVDGYWNYDKSEFEAPSAILDDDSAIERIWKEQYSLADFTAPSNFKSYEELKTRLDAVLSGKQVVSNQTVEDEPIAQPKVDTKPVENKQVEDEDTMDYFNKLANA
ncbi:single-stranded DNA-binding protein [Candidatus Woesearchaeota archaeon]|nr:single-stranded DNA-binding protein [Candidatus Woesearchaeota archaeon]